MSGYAVVIPAWNATAWLGDALRSVAAQGIAPDEVVVVDDGSEDDPAALVAGLGLPVAVRVVRQANAGPGAATTRGMAETRAPLIATLDADDLWLPGKMAAQMDRLAAAPAVAGVFARMESFHDGRAEHWVDDARSGWGRSTMVLRRAVVEAVGAFVDPPERRGETIDWLARARHAGHRFEMLDAVLARRRLHPGSLTARRDPAGDRAYAAIAWAAIRRKRGEPGA